jgi:pimeloyl-ACP methyl ester carboxylesterase
MQKLLIIALLLTPVLATRAQPAAEGARQRQPGDLTFSAYQMQFEGQAIEAELGRLVVRENRSNPKSNLIELAFVRLRSTTNRPGYPVVYLEGGPGASAIGGARFTAYMRAFMKLREVGDVILLDQRGVGLSRPNLTRISTELLPTNFFESEEVALKTIRERSREAAEFFRRRGVDLAAYNTAESADDIEDLRKAIGADKLNLVGFSYGTHLGLAVIRRHGDRIHRAALIGTEGPDHTSKLPSTSQAQLERLSKLVAKDPTVGAKVPDMVGLLRRILDRMERQPVTVRVTDQRTKRPVDLTVGKFGLQLIIIIDLGDTSDLPIFPALFYTIDRDDYSILARFIEKRYNQFGAGIPVMMQVMDASSGATRARRDRIARETKNSLLGNVMNFMDVADIYGNPDLGDGFRSPIKTRVPTLFVSGTLDNNTPPFQADEVRSHFKNSTHIVVKNAGHEDMLVNPEVQQAMIEYLQGRDVSKRKVSLPGVRFLPLIGSSQSSPY